MYSFHSHKFGGFHYLHIILWYLDSLVSSVCEHDAKEKELLNNR